MDTSTSPVSTKTWVEIIVLGFKITPKLMNMSGNIMLPNSHCGAIHQIVARLSHSLLNNPLEEAEEIVFMLCDTITCEILMYV